MFNSTNMPFTMAVEPCGSGGCNGNNGGWGGYDAWIWIILVFALIWGNNGWGNNNGNGGNGVQYVPYQLGQNYTDSAIQRGFDTQATLNGINDITSDLCNGFANVNQNIAQGTNGIQQSLCQGFNGVNSSIAQLGYQNQQCCCETREAIADLKYANAQNTCDIINAGNANTQRIVDLMTQNEMQTLRDNLQSAQFQLSQLSQTANIVGQLQTKTPIPAYITASPYQSQLIGCGAYGNFGNFGGCGGCNC